jgi:hypothetical protein
MHACEIHFFSGPANTVLLASCNLHEASPTPCAAVVTAAGSAVVEELGVDRLAAAEFMQLLGDKPTAKGPTDRASHNALLVVAEPQDTLATAVLRVASGTQVRMGLVYKCCHGDTTPC